MRRALALLLLLAGCSGGTSADPLAQPPAPPGRSAEAPAVRAARVEAAPDVAVAREVGTIRPWRTVSIAAEVSGRVLAVPYEIGERIDGSNGRGLAVAEIDPEAYRLAVERAAAALDAARARVELAKREHGRVLELSREGTGALTSEADLDRAENAVRLAEAEVRGAGAALAEARLALARTRVEAPPGYRVAARLVEPGDHVAPGRPLAELIDDRAVRMAFEVAGERLAAVAPGTEVPFEVKELPGRAFAGKVASVAPRAGERSLRFPVELRVENPGGELRPGMVAVALLRERRGGAPAPGDPDARTVAVVPRGALGRRLEEEFVLVLAPLPGRAGAARVERRTVAVLDAPDLPPSRVALSGVAPGETVALEGLARFRGGEEVRPVLAPPAAGPAAPARE